MSGCTSAAFGVPRSAAGASSKHSFPAVRPRTSACLCSSSLISMVQSTDLRNLNDLFRFVRLNCPKSWCVLIQRQMRAGFVIVAEVIFEYSAQVIIIDDDHMIQAVATNAANHPLHVAILPGTSGCNAIDGYYGRLLNGSDRNELTLSHSDILKRNRGQWIT